MLAEALQLIDFDPSRDDRGDADYAEFRNWPELGDPTAILRIKP